MIALGLGCAGLSASTLLVRKGLRPVSTCIRTSWPLRLVAGALLVHVVFRVPFDPLSALGARLAKP